MKTKIFVCSNSAIDYLPHGSMIESIPIILHFSEVEEYNDFYDVGIDSFYNRMRMDKQANVRICFQNYSKISKHVSAAVAEGYDEILFLLSSREFGDLQIPVSIAASEFTNIKCTVFNSNTCCYPLAYMALEASELTIQGKGMDEILLRLEHIRKNHHLFFFEPKASDVARGFHSRSRKAGSFYTVENGRLIKNEPKDKIKPWDQMIDAFISEIGEDDVIPFLLYTNKTSSYVHWLEEALIERNPSFKKIRTYPIPPAVGVQTGVDSIGLGYIVR